MSRNLEAVLQTQDIMKVADECTHHWVIETPSGPVSRGTCKQCGTARDFRNYVDNTPYWEDDSTQERTPVGASVAIGGGAEAAYTDRE